MSQKCQLTGRKTMSGNRVSHSNLKVKRTFKPNLQTQTMVNPATGKKMKVTLSTRAMKTLSKWQTAGKVFDLRKLAYT